MQVISNPQLPPGVCFICEQNPPETEFIDTGRTFAPQGGDYAPQTYLNGRKYICKHCIEQAAKTIGILDKDGFGEALLAEYENAKQLYTNLKEAVQEIAEDLEDLVPDIIADRSKPSRSRNSGTPRRPRSKAA